MSSHDISILFYIFKNLKTKKIQATKQSILPNKKYDIFQSIITFTNNLKVSLKLSWNYPAKIRNLVIFGTKNVFFDDLKPYEINISNKIIYNKRGLKSIGKDSKILLKENTKKLPLDIELDYFYNCLIGKLKPRSSKKLIMNTLNLMEKLNKS